jgi:hypothetical protein
MDPKASRGHHHAGHEREAARSEADRRFIGYEMPPADRRDATLYERERAELALGAHITKYLHIFAVRNVLDALRQRDLDKKTSALGIQASLAT